MTDNILDDAKTIASVDESNMGEKIRSFSDQVENAYRIGKEFSLDTKPYRDIDKVVFTGLGGSAIGADLISSFVRPTSRVPFFVSRNYFLPGCVDKKTLLVISSYSGDTEETLSALGDGLKKGARILAISTNGKLEGESKKQGFPCVKIPAGFPPRAALGYSFFPLLAVLTGIGLVEDCSKQVKETVSLLKKLSAEQYGINVPFEKNQAKQIARELYRHFVLIYAADDYFGTVALRWRGQIEENSKAIASHHVLPEMNHNEVVGWREPAGLLKESRAVILHDKGDYHRVSLRMKITRTLIERAGGKVIEAVSQGESVLARMFSLIHLGDYASYYLAILYGNDPTPVEVINYLKGELAKDKQF